ncbi:MAG: GNAT family N-acetyltransferase [Chloroflexi bacterium]|nr:GNAT family N-acetyltransferase [Chloroflexota bacterium]
MAVYEIKRYPRTTELRDGSTVELRPMMRDDADGLHALFQRVPESERFYLKEDVTDPDVLRSWAEHLDYDRALPLLATANGRVVADVVLLRQRGGSRRHAAEIRPVIDPEYRGKGLGVLMMRDLVDIAWDAELEEVIFETVADIQDEALQAASFLGAVHAGRVEALARDPDGHPHDVVFMRLPLGKYWAWSQF